MKIKVYDKENNLKEVIGEFEDIAECLVDNLSFDLSKLEKTETEESVEQYQEMFDKYRNKVLELTKEFFNEKKIKETLDKNGERIEVED